MIFSRTEKFFLFFAMCSAALIGGEYGITRPISNALFLTTFSVKAYPWVWLATVPLNLFVVYFYNLFLPKIGPKRMLFIFALAVAIVNILTGFFYSRWPEIIFFQYAWKDIYILLMFKLLWSMIHSTVSAARAKYLYGCIYGVGTLGGIGGSLIPGFLATSLGSERILLLTLPVYFLLVFTYALAFQRSGVGETEFHRDLTPNAKPSEALSLIRRSPTLIMLLFLVLFMQGSIALMEYQFNAHLELNVLDKDLRTAYCGRLNGLMNLLSLVFQFAGGFLMIKTFGLRGSHFLIPILLCCSSLFSWALPTFAIVSFSYVFLKAVDFSLFGVIREMLYVPLRLDEKFRAKAVIDVFAYRTSKAIVSLALLLLQGIAGSYLLQMASMASIALFIGWLAFVTFSAALTAKANS